MFWLSISRRELLWQWVSISLYPAVCLSDEVGAGFFLCMCVEFVSVEYNHRHRVISHLLKHEIWLP